MFVMMYIYVMNLSGIDLNLLTVLDALLDERSVTRAARRVGLSQSAMSNALARLRHVLGDPLLVRASKEMVPTPRAASLATPIREALSMVERALASDVFDPSVARRTFTIAAPDSQELLLAPRLMARLAVAAPQVQVRFIPPARGADPTELLRSEAADVALMNIAPIAPPLRTRQWFREHFVCISPKGLRGKLTLARFCALPHVLVAPYGTPGSFVDDALAKRGKSRTVAMRVSSFSSAPVIVAESDCIATFPSRLARRFAEWLPLKIHDLPLPVSEVAIGAAWHPRVDRDPAHLWFRDLLAAVASEL
jgi:DNA-binding transcriptional LysR family regulator